MALLPTSSPMEVTSQRMELMAVFMALESLDRPARVRPARGALEACAAQRGRPA